MSLFNRENGRNCHNSWEIKYLQIWKFINEICAEKIDMLFSTKSQRYKFLRSRILVNINILI